MVVKTFSASCFFLDNGLKSQQGTVQRFWNKIKFEGFTIDFKGNKWLLWSRCLELDKKKRLAQWWTCLNIFDSALNITGQQQTDKDHKNSQEMCFFFIIDAEKTRNREFQNEFQ